MARRGRRPGARSRSVVSRVAASCCACWGGRRGRRPPGHARGRGDVSRRAGGARDDLHQARPDAVARPDLLPDVYIEELEQLVDDVAPFPFDEARRSSIRRSGSRSSPASTSSRSPAPRSPRFTAVCCGLAERSSSRCDVPEIEQEIALDLELLRSLTSFAEGRSQTARLLQLSALADELETHLRRARLRRGSARLRADRAARRRLRASGRAGGDPSVRDRRGCSCRS